MMDSGQVTLNRACVEQIEWFVQATLPTWREYLMHAWSVMDQTGCVGWSENFVLSAYLTCHCGLEEAMMGRRPS